LQRRFGDEAVGDRLLDLLREAPVLEHHAVRVDDAPVELRQPRGKPSAQALELDGRLGNRAPEPLAFGLAIVGPPFFDQREADRRLEEVHAAVSEAGHGRQSREPRLAAPPRARLGALCRLLVGLQALDRRDHAAAVLATLLLLRLEVLEQPRLDDDAAHLPGDRAQEPYLVAREPPAAERLDHQHAHRRAALGDRHADEGMVFLLAGLREVLVPGMRAGIDRHHRLALLDPHAGETFLDAHRPLPDGALLEPRRRPEREALRARVEDVQRAHLRPHALGDHLDDALERLLEILRARGDRADVLENGETVGAAGLRPAGARTAALAAL